MRFQPGGVTCRPLKGCSLARCSCRLLVATQSTRKKKQPCTGTAVFPEHVTTAVATKYFRDPVTAVWPSFKKRHAYNTTVPLQYRGAVIRRRLEFGDTCLPRNTCVQPSSLLLVHDILRICAKTKKLEANMPTPPLPLLFT